MPFQYFGVADGTDLSSLRWRRGGYALEELDRVVTGNDARVAKLLEAIRRVVIDPHRDAGARLLRFRRARASSWRGSSRTLGSPSLAISGETPEHERVAALAAARDWRASGGVLGRRARRRRRRAERRHGAPAAAHRQRDRLHAAARTRPASCRRQAVPDGDRPDRPAAPPVPLRSALERDRRSTARAAGAAARGRLPLPSVRLPRRSRSAEQARSSSTNLRTPRACRSGGRWWTTCAGSRATLASRVSQRDGPRRRSMCTAARTTAGRACSATPARRRRVTRRAPRSAICCARFAACCTSTIPSASRFYRDARRLRHRREEADLNEREQRLLLMLHYDLWGTRRDVHGPRRVLMQALWRHECGRARARRAAWMCSTSGATRSTSRPASRPKSRSTSTRGTHVTRSSAPTGRGSPARPPIVPRGSSARRRRAATDLLLVTLKKAERDYSPTTIYQDYAISPSLFHWESQSTQSAGSPTIRRYEQHRAQGTQSCCSCASGRRSPPASGRRMCASVRPVRCVLRQLVRSSFTWELETPMPEELFESARTVAAA